MKSRPSLVVCAAVLWLAVGCGGGTPSGPTPTPTSLTVTSIAPNNGPTLGGTPVEVMGRQFSQGATLSIGGIAATQVEVVSSTLMRAVTGQRAAGVVDVVVTQAGASATLPQAFTYIAPPAPTNAPPVIRSISARGQRRNQPLQFADLDEQIEIAAVVEDAETQTSELSFEWKATVGAVSGSGARVTWRAPGQMQTPGDVTVTVTVVERFQTFDERGLPKDGEHRVEGTSIVRVHDSAREVSRLARDFLLAFSNSTIAPEEVIREFSDNCRGKWLELDDVRHNRQTYTIVQHFVGDPRVTIDFGGGCPFRNRPGDACAQVDVEWHSVYRSTGAKERAWGTNQVSAVYENRQWRLCESDFNGRATSGLRFKN